MPTRSCISAATCACVMDADFSCNLADQTALSVVHQSETLLEPIAAVRINHRPITSTVTNAHKSSYLRLHIKVSFFINLLTKYESGIENVFIFACDNVCS